jgi:hypothetical protein
MLTLHTNLDPVRRSLLLALGLLVACGDSKGDTSEGETTNTPSSSSSGGPSETGGTSSTSDEPTGTATGGGTGSTGAESSGGESTGGTTLATSGVSATEGSSSGGETTAGESTGDTVGPECAELLQNSDPPVPSGWVACDGKLPHRVEQVTCEVPTSVKGCGIDDPMDGCDVDADCVEKPFGSCHEFDDLGFLGCGCVYGCETDADCDPGFVCRCSGAELGPFTTCTPSECADDGECPGEVCQFANSFGEDCPFEVNDGHCSTPEDTCDNDPQCGTTGCLFSFDTQTWACGNAICGRPFMVEERPVTAAAQGREDWRALVAVPTVDAGLASRLAAHWTEIGLFEHASVASFARFILQLLAVGAPAALVTDAQRALADEVEHARVCFALASLYKGTGVGPGALAQAGDAGATGLAEITAAVIREACVGETLSALEVREAAARAEDAGLRQVLARIADDEQRHAELGWRFVQWALSQLDTAGRARATEAFTSAIAGAELEAARLADEVGAPELRAHGVIDAPLRAAVWRDGLRAIVAPSLRALAA